MLEAEFFHEEITRQRNVGHWNVDMIDVHFARPSEISGERAVRLSTTPEPPA
jgi:hypothetical protein